MPECGFAQSVQSERDFVDEGFACMLGVQHAYDVLCSRAPRGRYMDPRLLYDEHLLDNTDDYAITPFDNCKGIETRLPCFPPRYSPTFRGSRPTMGTTASCLDEVGDVYGGCADNRAPMPMPRSCLKGSRPLLAEDCTGGVACTNIRRVLFSPVESDSATPLTRTRAPRPCSDLIPGFKAGSLSNLAQALRLIGGSATHAIGARHQFPPACFWVQGRFPVEPCPDSYDHCQHSSEFPWRLPPVRRWVQGRFQVEPCPGFVLSCNACRQAD